MTDQQLQALDKRHLLMMIRDLEKDFRQMKEEKEQLLLAFQSGFAQGRQTVKNDAGEMQADEQKWAEQTEATAYSEVQQPEYYEQDVQQPKVPAPEYMGAYEYPQTESFAQQPAPDFSMNTAIPQMQVPQAQVQLRQEPQEYDAYASRKYERQAQSDSPNYGMREMSEYQAYQQPVQPQPQYQQAAYQQPVQPQMSYQQLEYQQPMQPWTPYQQPEYQQPMQPQMSYQQPVYQQPMQQQAPEYSQYNEMAGYGVPQGEQTGEMEAWLQEHKRKIAEIRETIRGIGANDDGSGCGRNRGF